MKITFALLVLILVVTNGFWAWKTLDAGITQTYMEASLDSVTKQKEQLFRIIEHDVVGLSSREALHLLNPDVFGSEPFEKDGCLYAGQICLVLNADNVVVGVESAL